MTHASDDSPADSEGTIDVDDHGSSRTRRLSILYSCGAFFVSYVITAGPAVFITRRFDQPTFESVVRLLYAPLILLVEANVPLVSPVIRAWIRLFQ